MVQVAIKANCWDGKREKVLHQQEQKETFTAYVVPVDKKWKFDPKLKALAGFAIPITLLAVGFPPLGIGRAMAAVISPGSVASAPEIPTGDAVPAMAGVSSALHAKILHAFDPLVNLIQDLSYPIAAVMIAAGSVFIMVGFKEKGMQMFQNAAIGYLLVQMVPMFLSLLVGVGGSL
jgi:hypothetical protein